MEATRQPLWVQGSCLWFNPEPIEMHDVRLLEPFWTQRSPRFEAEVRVRAWTAGAMYNIRAHHEFMTYQDVMVKERWPTVSITNPYPFACGADGW